MAKGKSGEGPARRGAKDPLLGELEETLKQPRLPANEVAPEIVPDKPAVGSASYDEAAVVKEALEHTMALGLSSPPPELTKIYGDMVPAAALEMYGKLKGKVKREGYLEKLASDEAEKKKRRGTPRKATAEPPVGDADVDTSGVEAVQQSIKENSRRVQAELNAEVEPPEVEEPIAPLNPMPSEFREQKPKADFIAEQLAATVTKKSEAAEVGPPQAEETIPDVVEPPPAIIRSNRGRPKIERTKAVPLSLVEEVEPEGVQSQTLVSEEKMTSKESRSLLGKLIDGYKKTLAGAKEKIGTAADKAKEYITNRNEKLGNTIKEWFTGSKEAMQTGKERAEVLGKFLANRNVSLGEKAKTLGKAAGENFMKTSEWYRTLPLRDKIGISAVFILGSIATGGAGTFVTLLGAAKLGQRTLASAGVYMLAEGLMEKRISKKEEGGAARTKWDTWKKHGTATAASLAVFSGLPGYALKEMFEAAGGERAVELVGGMLGYSASAPEVSTAPRTGVLAPTTEGHPGHETPNFERPGVPQPTAPDLRVPTAAPDFQLNHSPQPPIDDEVVPPAGAGGTTVADEAATPTLATPEISVEATPGKGSEYMMKRLWEQLQEKRLDASQYAEDSDMHKLLTATPENIDVVVHQMAIDPQHGFFHSDGASVRIDLGSHMTINAEGQIEINGAVQAPANAPVTPAYQPSVAAEQAVVPQDFLGPVSEPLVMKEVTTPASFETIDVTNAPEFVSEPYVETPSANVAEEVAIQPPAPVVERGFISNQFGLNVPVAEAHIYADPGAAHTLVFGGSVAEQAEAIQKHLLSNPDTVVYGTDNTSTYLIPFHLVDGKVSAGPPMRTSGILGFFSTWMKAPEPDDLEKLIK